MTKTRFDEIASAVVLVGALALIVNLFLGWHRVAVQAGGVVDIHATNSGWNGWGIAGGAFAIALVLQHARSLSRGATGFGAAFVTTALATGALGFTVGEALVGAGTTVVTPGAAVAVESTLWPAYAAVGLAAAIAVAALVRLVLALPAPGAHASARPA